MNRKTDIVFINPGDRRQVFQNLGDDIAAIEPPFWIVVLAAFLRKNHYNVQIIDSNALNITPEETAMRVADLDPKLAAVIVYGSQPSASTQNMTIAGKICQAIRNATNCKIAMGGLHPSALPEQTLREEAVDFVIKGEGHETLRRLLEEISASKPSYSSIPGLWYFEEGRVMSLPQEPVRNNLDDILPIGAWDLLPMEKYRAHNWHCFQNIQARQPYAAIYTSLGCPYSCVFCCINAPFGKPGIRYRSPDIVLEEIGLLVRNYNVKNLKIIDELFVLHEKHYMEILDRIVEQGYDLNMWAYARVDTVKPENLPLLKKAGVNWLALGIESANPDVRDGASKKMRVKDIQQVVGMIRDAGINVIGNYIFGLPDDTLETMQETLDLAMELNCEFANFYCAMAYPGSQLYGIALENKWPLPSQWHGFSQHSYEIVPLPTKHLTPKEVLCFRDEAFHSYFENPVYLDMVAQKFSPDVKGHMGRITKTRLRRKLLES
ncbi:MAG: radical SAM protein [Spirochaetaceae bacterium]|nr:MAG: radical SAM protein [Spirochaetaceae bacterium]